MDLAAAQLSQAASVEKIEQGAKVQRAWSKEQV